MDKTNNDEEIQELDPMSLLFVHEYLVDRNGTQAAIRAGFQGKNPAWFAWKRLQNPIVRAMIDQLTADKLAAAGLRSDTILKELAQIATANFGEFVDDFGNLDPARVKEWGHLVESMNVSRSTTAEGGSSAAIRVKLHSKMAALEKAMKFLKLTEESVKVDLTNSDGSLSPTQNMSDEELKAEAAKRGLPTDIFGS